MTRERFSLRTVLIPLAAVLGFFSIQLIVTIVYLIVSSLISGWSGTGMNLDLTPEEMTNVLMKQATKTSAIYSIIVAGAASLTLYFLGKKNKHALRREKVSTGTVLASLIIIVGTTGLIALEMAGIVALGDFVPFIKSMVDNYSELSQAFVGDGNIVMIIISTCILVPIAEELVFRGIIQGELRRVFPAGVAILLQAIIFAIVHGNIIQISYVIFPALVLGLVYEWTKSIYVPMILHMTFNFIGSALSQILAQNETALLYVLVVEIAMIPAAVLGIFYLRSKRTEEVTAPNFLVQAQMNLPSLQPVMVNGTSDENLSNSFNIQPIDQHEEISIVQEVTSSIPETILDKPVIWIHKDIVH